MSTYSSIQTVGIASSAALNRIKTYSNTSVLPLTSLTAGELAFIPSNQTLYVTNGSGWYKVSFIYEL